MKKKTVAKSRPGTVTIRIDNTDFARLGRLRAFLGGGSASSALKYALKAADEQREAFQKRTKYEFPLSPAPGVGPFGSGRIVTQEYGNLAGGSQKVNDGEKK